MIKMKVSLEHPLFQKALPVIKQIESHGFEAYFVGGCVRDTVLGRPIHDIDIATSAYPEEVEQIFMHTFDVGKKHGTIVVLYQSDQYEITTFRTEGSYSDYRRPDQVQFVRNLEEDTLRRDFTINALAIDSQGRLYDFHGGIEDLSERIIRCVGIPSERFGEDALRILRAVRFASQLNFAIESQTMSAIQSLNYRLNYIAVERIKVEFMKFLEGRYYSQQYSSLLEGRIGDFLPGLSQESCQQCLPALAEEIAVLSQTEIAHDAVIIWARLLYYLQLSEESIRPFLKKWTHSNEFIYQTISVMDMLNKHTHNNFQRWDIYQYSESLLQKVETYLVAYGQINKGQIIEIKKQLPIQNTQELAINGTDIMEYMGMSRGGPMIGKIIDQMEYLVVYQQLKNTKSALLAYLDSKIKRTDD